MPVEFGPTANSAIRSADPEIPSLEEPNVHEADLITRCGDIAVRNFQIERSVGRSLVGRQYILLLFGSLGT